MCGETLIRLYTILKNINIYDIYIHNYYLIMFSDIHIVYHIVTFTWENNPFNSCFSIAAKSWCFGDKPALLGQKAYFQGLC